MSLAPLALAGFGARRIHEPAGRGRRYLARRIASAGARLVGVADRALSGSLLLLAGAILAKQVVPPGAKPQSPPSSASVPGGPHRLAGIERLAMSRPALYWPNSSPVRCGVAVACAVGASASAEPSAACAGRCGRRGGGTNIERALTDNFGHADWMAIVEARSLFDGGRASMGGVVIGEAYRVDQDASVHRQFDPRNSTSWGQGGQAPLLIYDLSFGATHGIAFAGSGGFKA